MVRGVELTGQTLVVSGSTITLMDRWLAARTIDAGDRRWNPSELHEASAELFEGRDREQPPIPDLGLEREVQQ